MLLREFLPSQAHRESNRFKPFFRFLDNPVLRTFKGSNPHIFKHKNIQDYCEIEAGYFVGINIPGNRPISFPLVQKPKIIPRLEKLYAFTHNDERKIIAQLYKTKGNIIILQDINTLEKFYFETSIVLLMRKKGTFRDATIADKAAYLLRSEE